MALASLAKEGLEVLGDQRVKLLPGLAYYTPIMSFLESPVVDIPSQVVPQSLV
jgi:hypothetical protein